MKVYSCPEEVPFEAPDYANYDTNREQQREAEHRERLTEWLRANGYAGPRTGDVLYEPHADGYAQYMLGDGRSSILINLPYGDAWHSPNVQHLPKKEVLARIDRSKSRPMLAPLV